MNDLTVLPKIEEGQRLKQLVLDSVSSPITKRMYNMALDEFESRLRLPKISVRSGEPLTI